MSGRISLGGVSTNPATSGANTRADLATFTPSDSILPALSSPLESFDLSDSASDILAALRIVALVLVVSVLSGASVLYFLFL